MAHFLHRLVNLMIGIQDGFGYTSEILREKYFLHIKLFSLVLFVIFHESHEIGLGILKVFSQLNVELHTSY